MTYEPSSQAGLASYISTGPGAPVIRRPTFRAPCITPGCDGHLTMTRVRSSIDGDPTWRESCDTCPYEMEL